MSSKENLFLHVIDIGLRVYGNGRSFPLTIVQFVHEEFRQYLSNYFHQHLNLISIGKNDRQTFFTSFIYLSRHNQRRLKRLKQYLQAKERQENEIDEKFKKSKQISSNFRFERICHQLEIEIDENPSLDRQRARQYVRLDEFYRNQQLTSKEYLSFVDEQNHSFNQIRSLSIDEILQWLNIDRSLFNEKSFSIVDLRLSELCLFLLKEYLLDLMDEMFRTKNSSTISDVFRRRYVRNQRRKSN